MGKCAMRFTYAVDNEITLELQSPAHAPILYPLIEANRAFIGRFQTWVQRIESLDDMQRLLQRDLQGMAKGRRWAWLIRYQGEPVGRIGLFVTMPDLGECEFSYWLAESFTGKGIITRALRPAIDFAFTELNLRHILIGFDPDNVKSKAIPERLGFQHEFTARKQDLIHETWHDLEFYGMMYADWQVTTQPRFTLPLDDSIYLRLQQVYDADAQFALIEKNLADLRKWFLFAHEEHTLKKEGDYTTKMLERYADNTSMMLGIWDEDTLIGSIGVYVDIEDNKAGIGYWLDSDWRSEGIMTQCVRAVIDDCFTQRNVRRVEIRAAPSNTASRRVAEKAGLQQEVILRDQQMLNGRYLDHVIYGILAHEWEAQHA
jgi:ribosomal-protein-serine acetyltransferase